MSPAREVGRPAVDTGSLWEIEHTLFEALLNEADDEYDAVTREVTPEAAERARQQIKGLMGRATDKRDALAGYILRIERFAQMVRDEEVRLAQRRQRLDARADRLKRYALDVMMATGQRKLEGPLHTMLAVKNPPSVAIGINAKIPADYERVVPETRAPDKAKLRDALEGGEQIEGVALIPSWRLQIK